MQISKKNSNFVGDFTEGKGKGSHGFNGLDGWQMRKDAHGWDGLDGWQMRKEAHGFNGLDGWQMGTGKNNK